MKIIFLDIDGVLNSKDTVEELYDDRGLRLFNDVPHIKHVNFLNKIIEVTNAKIVITSTWRNIHTHISLMYIFHLCGVKGDIVGVIPKLHKKRGYEIQQWLDDSKETIESFVIIDDDSDMVHLKDHLVQTNGRYGLTSLETVEAINKLNGGI